jgi:hypothetical protein
LLFWVHFGGQDNSPTPGIEPLTCDRAPSNGWGAVQDRTFGDPAIRHYRWTTSIGDVAFPTGRFRDFAVRASGQCHLHHEWSSLWNISGWTRMVTCRVWDDKAPPAPRLETPLWTSLPDAAGVGRFNLNWQAQPLAERGYLIYEATETSVRDALGIGEPDLTESVTTRLNALLNHPAADFSAKREALRKSFKRITTEPISPGRLSHEVALPRGSKVLHFFTVSAVGGNGQESLWPATKEGYCTVAVPRLATPQPPIIEVKSAVGPEVAVTVELAPPGGLIELHRIQSDARPTDVDAMGPPIQSRQVPGGQPVMFRDSPPPGWRKLWYAATVRSSNDSEKGIVASRSPASMLASLVLPPVARPELTSLRVNEPRSTATASLASCLVTAPLAATPLGAHRFIVEVRGAPNGPVLHRLDEESSAIPVLGSASAFAVPVAPASIQLAAVREGAGHRIYAWLPRAGTPVYLAVKLIDPIGRLVMSGALVPAVVIEPINWDATAQDLRGRDGEHFRYSFGALGGAALKRIWGTGYYTDDSPIAVAAVHAGVATLAGGSVTIEILPGQAIYDASTRNGITSESWGPWHGSYRFI